MSDIGKELFRVADDFASHMRLLDILRSQGEDTGPLEQTIAAYFTHDVTRDKIDSVIGYIRYCDQMAEAATAEIQRLKGLWTSWEIQKNWLKETAKSVLEMSGQKRLEGLTAGSLTLQKAGGRQAVTITDASLVPEEYVQYAGTISGAAWQIVRKHFFAEGWYERADVQMERIPHKGRIGEALSRKCGICDGTGAVEDEGCNMCGGDGLQRVPGCRLEPRGSSIVLR